ncbi:uncharacterized protein [Palaemon carinicauda]|uniref:uncharacterized protein n=1 Tax=Palaemon carinicauda TaxID=392227 RepID=UPI0035B69BC5
MKMKKTEKRRVLILGHSQVKKMLSAFDEINEEDETLYAITHSIGGATCYGITSEEVKECEAEAVVLFVGSNDIDNEDVESTNDTRNNIIELVNDISNVDGVKIVYIVTVEPPGLIIIIGKMTDRAALMRSRGGHKGVITKWINKIDSAVAAGNGSPGNPSTTPKTNVRLPKLDLPHYTEDVLECNSFWELYNVLVDQQGDLELIEIFSYLQSLLTRDALKLISGFKSEAVNYSQAISLLQATYGKKDEIKRVLVRRLLEMESPSPDSESLQSFRANFECSIRSLESENLELNELYTILLHGKLPKSVSKTVKRRYGDDWLVFGTFKKYLEEIHNLRSFVSADVNKPGTLSTISTFTVNQSQSVRPKSKGNVNKFSSQQTRKCALCEGEHWWTQCKTYASRDKKLSRLGFLRLCFVCASNKHFSVDYEKQICGNGCRLKQHRVLCDKQQTSKPKKSTTKSASKPNNNGVQVGILSVSDQGQKSKQRSILPTTTIVFKGKGRHLVRLRGLLDTCAERTFINGQHLRTYNIDLKARKKIALSGYLTSKPVNYYETVSVSIPYKGSCNAPPVQETQVTVLKLTTNEEVIEATHKFDSDIRNDFDILWNLDKVGIECNELKEHDRKVLEDFENTIVYSEMALPWKSNKPRLLSNFCMALSRVKQQCAKFQNDEAYLNHYQKILKDQEDRGFIDRVNKNNVVENCHYLVHHRVQKDSATISIRIVFDCSWRQGKNGLSLNDCLWTGPHITTNMLKVLLQFRTNNYACISDIEKAFLMVQLREEDRNYTRFLRLQDPTDPNSELIIYRFRVVLFGATSSPFLLNATIKSHLAAVRKDTSCTEMVDMMNRGLYVDNLQFTSNSEDELIN